MHVLLFWTNQFFTLHHFCLKGDRFLFWPFDNIKLCTTPCTPLKMQKGSPPLSIYLYQIENKLITDNLYIKSKNNLKPSPPAFSIWNLKKTMKMTWLHMEFVLIFITGSSQAKFSRMVQQQLLTLALMMLLIQSIFL